MNILLMASVGLASLTLGLLIGWVLFRRSRTSSKPLESSQVTTASDTRFDDMIDFLPFGVVVIDTKGIIQSFNDAAVHLIGDSQIKGRSINEAFPLTDPDGNSIAITADTLKEFAQPKRDIILQIQDKETVLEVSAPSVRQHDTAKETCIVLLRDITDEKTLEQRQNEFISTAWHELRTPLTIAEGYLSTTLLKLDTVDVQSLRSGLETVHKNIIDLSKFANDLGTLYLSENDYLTVLLKKIEPVELLTDIIKKHEEAAQKKDITIELEVKNSTTIINSTSLLSQIITEILENAIKFSSAGKIYCVLDTASDNSNDVIFSIIDNGKGIDESLRPNLFKRFFRGGVDFERTGQRGIGIGLAITARLTERLGGRIWYEKTKRGSTFTIQIPPYPLNNQDSHQLTNIETQRLFESL